MVYPNIISPQKCSEIQQHIADTYGAPYKIRDVLRKDTWLKRQVVTSACSQLPHFDRIVRSVLFQKPQDFNWAVPWHQDVLVQVTQQQELPGYSAWSCKEGVHHVQPPIEVLRRLWSFRVHVSDCGPEDGPLRVIPGSHRNGIHNFAGLAMRDDPDQVIIECNAGDVLVFHPLLLHSSCPVQRESPRTVLHFECCSFEFSNGLSWLPD